MGMWGVLLVSTRRARWLRQNDWICKNHLHTLLTRYMYESQQIWRKKKGDISVTREAVRRNQHDSLNLRSSTCRSKVSCLLRLRSLMLPQGGAGRVSGRAWCTGPTGKNTHTVIIQSRLHGPRPYPIAVSTFCVHMLSHCWLIHADEETHRRLFVRSRLWKKTRSRAHA